MMLGSEERFMQIIFFHTKKICLNAFKNVHLNSRFMVFKISYRYVNARFKSRKNRIQDGILASGSFLDHENQRKLDGFISRRVA